MPLVTITGSTFVPSIVNCTVPVASEGEIVAVKVTDSPYFDGLGEEVTTVVVSPLFTICVMLDDVLGLKLASPLYDAETVCVGPTGIKDVL